MNRSNLELDDVLINFPSLYPFSGKGNWDLTWPLLQFLAARNVAEGLQSPPFGWILINPESQKSWGPHSPTPTVQSLRCPQAQAQLYCNPIWTFREIINKEAWDVGFLFKLWWLVPRTPLTCLWSRSPVCSDHYNRSDPKSVINSLNVAQWILPLSILPTFFFGTSWGLYMFLTLALTFEILEVLPKRLSNRGLVYRAHLLACLTSAALMLSSPPQWDNDHSWHVQACLPNDSCVWGVAGLTTDSRHWQDLIIFCSCVYISQVCLKKSRKQYSWVSQMEMIMKLPLSLFSFCCSRLFSGLFSRTPPLPGPISLPAFSLENFYSVSAQVLHLPRAFPHHPFCPHSQRTQLMRGSRPTQVWLKGTT